MKTFTNEEINAVENNLSPVEVEAVFDEAMDEIYGDVTLVGGSYETLVAKKEIDDVEMYDRKMSEFFEDEANGFIEVNGAYYYSEEVDELLAEMDQEQNQNNNKNNPGNPETKAA